VGRPLPDGKQRKRIEIGNETLAKMEASKTPARVQQVVGEVMQKYEHQINGKLQRANDAQQIAVHAQVRDRDATVNCLAVDKIGECA
jgi:delta 1-pyrroline-5-carboxylate dehydrogenase